MQQIVFGNYLPGNSLIHRLNPVTKILAVLLLITWTLVANNWLNYGILGCALIVQISAARLSLSMMLHTIIPFLWLIGFTLLIQILFGTGGTIYFHWGVVKITSTGLVTAGLILVRFTLIIMEAALLTMTTSPNAIAAGIERLLQPLKRLKVPVSTIGMMISIALRFIPTLLTELQTIMDAQRSRGTNFNQGKLWERVRNIGTLIIPLLVASFRHADHLADALGASGYSVQAARTSYRKFIWRPADTGSLGLVIVLGLLVLGTRGF